MMQSTWDTISSISIEETFKKIQSSSTEFEQSRSDLSLLNENSESDSFYYLEENEIIPREKEIHEIGVMVQSFREV